MAKVKIVIDDTIPKDLIPLYRESIDDEFVGNGGMEMTDKEIKEELEIYKSTTVDRLVRLGIMKIYFLGNLVGFSIPRPMAEREYPAHKITGGKWYRVGTVFISKKYRGLGIMKEALRLFIDRYKNVMWSCNSENIASEKTALSVGMEYSHSIYLGLNGKWDIKPFHGVKLIIKIFKTS